MEPTQPTPPTLGRVLASAAGALIVGLGAVSLAAGFSDSPPLRVLQGAAVFAGGAIVLGAAVTFALVHLGNWREPESEEDFEALVLRAERLAGDGPHPPGAAQLAGDGSHPPGAAVHHAVIDDPFQAAVRAALDELPLELHRVLEHVAIVVSDGGAERHAYGLYEGDTVTQDYFHDRILIFRDTLMRDFGHDPDLLRAQVTRTVRHELAHHLGWGEAGVRRLGL